MCEIRTEKEKQERQYCNICGSGLAEHGTERYNEVTGEEIKSKHCTNLNCERGCSYKGHQFKYFFSQTCSRCGYDADSYGL